MLPQYKGCIGDVAEEGTMPMLGERKGIAAAGAMPGIGTADIIMLAGTAAWLMCDEAPIPARCSGAAPMLAGCGAAECRGGEMTGATAVKRAAAAA